MIDCRITLNQGAIEEIYNKAHAALISTAQALQDNVVDHDLMPYYAGPGGGESEKSTFVYGEGNDKAIIYCPAYYSKWNYFKDVCWYTQEPFRRYVNPNAQGHWWDAYRDGKANGFDVTQTFRKYMTIYFGGGGG